MRNYCLALLLLAVALPVQAAQDLMQIYQQALAKDPVWASAQNANRAAQEKIVQGQAQYLPVVSIAGNANSTNNDLRFVGGGQLPPNVPGARRDGVQRYDGYNLSFNVVQPIFRPQIRAQLEQAKSIVQQSDLELAMTRQNLILRSSQLYFDVLLAQDKIQLIESQKQAISQQLAQAKARFEQGLSTVTDVNEDQARLDLVQSQLIAAANELEIKKRALQALIGDMPQALLGVREDLVPLTPEPSNIEKWVEMANLSNLRIAMQQQAVEIAAQEVERQNAGHLPSLDFVGSYTDSYVNGGIAGIGLDQKITVIGMQLAIPIFQGGAVTSRVREAVANKLKAQDDLEAARRQADMETRQAYLNLVSTVAQISALEQALNSAKSQLESTQLGYEVGVRNSVEVLNSQQLLFNAKRDLLQARYAYLMNILTLKASVGALAVSDLEAVNQQLVAQHD
jgi:outer membrane protein